MYRLLPSEPTLEVSFDAGLLDKVFTNLLSNAFNFTPDRGMITVTVQLDNTGKQACVRVEDNGRGISPEDQLHIFDWFYQGQNTTSLAGSGIGLALSNELVQLHQGSISVTSQLNQGSIFELCLPVNSSIPAYRDISSTDLYSRWNIPALTSIIPVESLLLEERTAGLTDGLGSETTLLLIENNVDIANFLRNKLQQHFHVKVATESVEGLYQASTTLPDLIVCDVMMPDRNGLELVASLKSDWRTSHIPVVMLTARNAPEQQLEGIQAGADLYLTKPISPAYLIESLKALMRYRERIRDQFRRELSLETVTLSPQRIDRGFVDTLTQTVEENLFNADLTVDQLAELMGLSRMQLYRKLKAQVGCSVTDFIQTIRLNKARELLLKPSTTVADVAYSVGFSSPTYFATAFKHKFNLTPSEFKNLHMANVG